MFKSAEELYEWAWCRGIPYSQVSDMAVEYFIDGVSLLDYKIYSQDQNYKMDVYFESMNYDGNEFDGGFHISIGEDNKE